MSDDLSTESTQTDHRQVEREQEVTPLVISARSARNSATAFNFGNMLAVCLPPLGILWVFGSIVVYTVNRHHPNERVGFYTQHAAYRFYGLAGLVVAGASFYSNSLTAWLATWAICAAIIIPWSIFDLFRIYKKEDWQDTIYEKEIL